MPKPTKKTLLRDFVQFINKKYVLDILEILHGSYPNHWNNFTFSEFGKALNDRGLNISPSQLSIILKNLEYKFKIITKRNLRIPDPFNSKKDILRKSYYFTPEGFIFVNDLLHSLPDELLSVHNQNLDEIKIGETFREISD